MIYTDAVSPIVALRTSQFCFRLPFASFRAVCLVTARLMSAMRASFDVLDHRTHTHKYTHAHAWRFSIVAVVVHFTCVLM